MIIDFITIKNELQNSLNILLRSEVQKRTPFLSSIDSHIQHEGRKATYQTDTQEIKDIIYKAVSSGFSYTWEEMSKLTLEDIIKKMEEVAEDMAGQMERGAFKNIFEEIEKVGNTIPGNPSFSPDALLKGLEMVHIDFTDDDRTKPRLPTVYVSPAQAEKVKEEEAKATLADKQQFKEKEEKILDKKYEEFMEREGKRKLVD